jgi:hypothetical protein
MCRYEEHTYVGADGLSSTRDYPSPCEKATRVGRMCPKPRTTEYNHKRSFISRDDTPSPVNPPTPTGPGTYIVQQRRPSGSGSRPSTRDGQRIKPEIIIQIGSSKGKDSKYSSVSVSSKGYHRSSLGTGSAGSSGVAVGSPSSDIFRTGFPEAPLPPPAAFDQRNSYIPTPAVSHGYHHRHTSSASSSRTPSLYVTSDHDYDPPASQRTARHPAVIHNPPTAAPPSPSRRQAGASSASYFTSTVVPQGYAQNTNTSAGLGLSPLDYADFAVSSGSSHASSGTSDPTRRPKNSDERRRRNEEDRRRQEERDRQDLDIAENEKHVRFEVDRAESRKEQRAEQAWAEKEKDRATAREEARRRKEEERLEREQRELDEKMAKDRRKEKSKPPTTDYNNKRPSSSRRMSTSMTPAQLAEQRRLLEADGLHMQGEREAAEAREREERAAAIRQQQETASYYDPRGGDRTLSNNTSGMARRGSISRHDSVTSTARPSGLTRTNSRSKRRSSISQSNPPAVITQVPTETYSTRPPSSRTRAPPPLSFPPNFNQDLNRAPPSTRRPSFTQENPFAAPPTRGSGSNIDSHFTPVPSMISPSSASASSRDPWDLRNVGSALPPSRPSAEPRYNNMRERGEAVINRSTSRAKRTSRIVDSAMDCESDSDSPEDQAPVYASRTGLSGKGRKKH